MADEATTLSESRERVIDMKAEEQEIDLLELLYKLIENLKYIILAAFLGTLLAALYVFFIATPVYEATSELYVMSNNDSAVNLSDLQIGSYLTNDYQEVFNTWEVHEMVISNLGLPYSYEEIEKMLTITNPSDTRILKITAASTNAAEAQMISNEYASVARTYISEKMGAETPSILSTALLPTKPVSPKKAQTILIGLLLGIVLAIAIIVIHFIYDDKIKTADDIRKYIELPTLAIIPVLKDAPTDNLPKKTRRRIS